MGHMFFFVGVLYDQLRGRIAIALEDDPDKDLGASAIEWAIIAAISVIMAAAIGYAIFRVVDTKKGQIQSCSDPTQPCEQ